MAHALTFSPDQDESFFQELPAAAAVFVLRGDGEPYISKTANLRRRLFRLLGPPPEQSKRLNLRERVREVEFTPAGSDFESQFLLYKILRENFPKTYAKRLRLRPAPLVKLHLENEYPRASVTTRLGKLNPSNQFDCHSEQSSVVSEANDGTQSRNLLSDAEQQVSRLHNAVRSANHIAPLEMTAASGSQKKPHNFYYGPFSSRVAAEKFASDALDFFKMRRCVDDLHPDPSFPGCVYSEMKMCLAPCFQGCTDDEYQSEVARVQDFFDSGGDSLTRELAEQRDRASADLAFEEAAAVHAKIEKLKPLLAQLPEIVHRIDRLQAIIIQPCGEPNSVALFRFLRVTLQGPIPFSIQQSGEPQSMESRVESALAEFPTYISKSSSERSEDLAMLKRWYYRSNRVGEIFFADEKGTWPLRRIVRGIGRVYRGEKEQEPASFSATAMNSMPSEPT